MSAGWGSSSTASLAPRLRFVRGLGVPSSAVAATPFRRPDARDSRWVSSDGAADPSREAMDRPRLREEAELTARVLRIEASFSVFMTGAGLVSGWPRLGFLSSVDGARWPRLILGGGDISIASTGDWSRSLMGLTSSGRGRGGELGELETLGRGVLFHGVEEPCVSIDRRGWEARDSENEGNVALGVWEIRGRPIGTGV